MHFYKLQGAGNDFIVFDNRDGALTVNQLAERAPQLCERRFGIGADGVMALFPPVHTEEAYTMVYRNADGSDAGMCGNGGRCIARLAVHLGIDADHRFRVHDVLYKAEVGIESVTLDFPAEPTVRTITDDSYGSIYQVYTGTEHIVVTVSPDELTNSDLLRQKGRSLRYDKRFSPAGTNVNFISADKHSDLRLVTYERGVEDLTLACGTGTLAAAIVNHHLSATTPEKHTVRIAVHNPGGELTSEFNKTGDRYTNLRLAGPAEIVFEGDVRV